jgi:hypothetical protein
MPARTYSADKKVVPLQAKPPIVDRQIPDDAKLYDIAEASQLLTHQYGKGWSIKVLRRLIESGEWVEGWHYIKPRKFYKIYLPAVRETILNQS